MVLWNTVYVYFESSLVCDFSYIHVGLCPTSCQILATTLSGWAIITKLAQNTDGLRDVTGEYTRTVMFYIYYRHSSITTLLLYITHMYNKHSSATDGGVGVYNYDRDHKRCSFIHTGWGLSTTDRSRTIILGTLTTEQRNKSGCYNISVITLMSYHSL